VPEEVGFFETIAQAVLMIRLPTDGTIAINNFTVTTAPFSSRSLIPTATALGVNSPSPPPSDGANVQLFGTVFGALIVAISLMIAFGHRIYQARTSCLCHGDLKCLFEHS
jgi:hypothetical protein